MADKSTLNKLYYDILLSKNKLPLLQTYYSNIKNEILTNITNLHNSVISAQSWVNAQINYLNNSRTEQATASNNFIASSSDNLIVSHPKYLEMMKRYTEYVSAFYERIHSLENPGVSNSYTVNNFLKNEIGQLSSFWKFHYIEDYRKAVPFVHKYCALNITKYSKILEVSNSRFLYTNDNKEVYDVDYITKDVYIIETSDIGEHAEIKIMFSLPDKDKVYAYIAESDSTIVCYEYDGVNHEFVKTEGDSSDIICSSNAFETKLNVVNSSAINGYYFVVNDDDNGVNHISRVRIDGTFETDNDRNNMQCTSTQSFGFINNEVLKLGEYFIFNSTNDSNNATRIIACKVNSSNIIDTANPVAEVTLNAFADNDPRFNTDNTIVCMFKADNVGGSGEEGLYVVTNNNIWFIHEIVEGSAIDVVIDNRKLNIGVSDYSFIENEGLYYIDEFGYLYILKDHTYLYCAKTDATGVSLYGNVVQSPTRYAEKLINLKNVITENKSGYAFNTLDNITSSQLGDEGNEEFIYSFVKKENELDPGVLYGITKSGKVAFCDISTGVWNGGNSNLYCSSSFTGGREITAVCADENTMYFALRDYSILKVTQSELISAANIGADLYVNPNNFVYNTASGSKITAMVYIESYKVLYIADSSGRVSAFDFNNDTYHTADISSPDYNEFDKTRYAITRGDNAIGPNNSINCITTDGNNLIVMGASGRVASCSLSTFKWTPYNVTDEEIGNYDSNIFYNGTYLKDDGTTGSCRDIVSFINYNNIKLVVFTVDGEVFSCSLVTGVWTAVNGKIILHNGSGFGPGIYNDGSIIGSKTPKAVIRIGTVIYVSGEAGRLASISILDGGITNYKGTNYSINVGPGYFYTGEDVAETIVMNTLTTDNRGKIFMLGTNNSVLTYSIESNEAMIPTNSKLYYIARRQSKYDLTSSLLVRVSKGELNEKVPLYPPYEEEDVFTSVVNSSAFVFKNGDIVWKINSSLDNIYISKNNGVTYDLISTIENKEILPREPDSDIISPVVDMPVGRVTKEGLVVAIFNIGITSDVSYMLVGNEDGLRWVELTRKLPEENSLYTSLFINNDTAIFIANNSTGREDEYQINILTGETTYQYIDETITRERVYIDIEDNLYKDNKLVVANINDKLRSYLHLNQDQLNFLDVYLVNENVINVVVYKDVMSKIVVSLFFDDITKGDIEGNLKLYNIALSSTSMNCKIDNKGRLFHISSGGSLDVLETKIYGDNVILEKESVNLGDYNTDHKIIAYDPDESKLIIAEFNSKHKDAVDKVISYTLVNDVVDYTPVRALTDAWRTFQVTLGNGSSVELPNAVNLELSFNRINGNTQKIADGQFTLRYKVLISNISDGKFILYEVEKSMGMSKTDDDTRSVEPFFRVLAIDGFEDEIFEFYTHKIDQYHKSKNITDPNGLTFMSVLQRFSGSESAVYQIKIKCENTLPSGFDASFFIKPFTSPVVGNSGLLDNIKSSIFGSLESAPVLYKNEITTSEYKNNPYIDLANVIYFLNNSNVTAGQSYTDKEDVFHINNQQIPFIEATQREYVSPDTYICIVRGDGHGLYDKTSCVTMNKDGKDVLVPLSKNKKGLRYVYDADGSKGIVVRAKSKIDVLRNGRTVHKMYNRSVFSKNVINNPDYYVDYNGRGRIVSVEGTMVTHNGLFESISSLDGNQKRISQISEVRDGNKWFIGKSAYDNIKNRELGYGYDIIDRYSVFEAPYNMIKAWWIPARGLISKGNERLLHFTFNEGKRREVGLKYSPNDYIEDLNAVTQQSNYKGGEATSNGVTAAVNGATITSPSSVLAYVELIDEKFPLENWSGWEWAKMCFIRKWRKVFVDKHIEYNYEVEAPSEVTVDATGNVTLNSPGSPIFEFGSIPYTEADFAAAGVQEFISKIKPSIDKQLYMYSDERTRDLGTSLNNIAEFEGISEEKWRRATAYYYSSHAWKVILDEILVLDHKNFFTQDEELNKLYQYHNFAQLTEAEFIAYAKDPNNIVREWYVKASTDSVNLDNVELHHHDDNYSLDNGQRKPHFLDDDTDRDVNRLNNSGFPLPSSRMNDVIGERIVHVEVPITDDVMRIEATRSNVDLETGEFMPGKIRFENYVRGLNTPIVEETSVDEDISHDVLKGIHFKRGEYVNDKYYMEPYNKQIWNDKDSLYEYFTDDSQHSRDYKMLSVKAVAQGSGANHGEYIDANQRISEVVENFNTHYGINAFGDLYYRLFANIREYKSEKSGVIWNMYGFNYGVGIIKPVEIVTRSILAEGDDNVIDRTVSVTIRQYRSITPEDISQHPEKEGMFVGYDDHVYSDKVYHNNYPDRTNTSVEPAYTSGPNELVYQGGSNKIGFSNGQQVIDSYCGPNTFKYLCKNNIRFNVNNLKKSEGYINVYTDLSVFSVVNANTDLNTVAQIIELRTNYDSNIGKLQNIYDGTNTNDDGKILGFSRAVFNYLSGKDLQNYGEYSYGVEDYGDSDQKLHRLVFFTQNYNQHFSTKNDDEIVDRLFIKQQFARENNTEVNALWRDYVMQYSIEGLPLRNRHKYQQKYYYLIFKNNRRDAIFDNIEVNSRYCWVHLTEGDHNNINMKITSTSENGLDSYVAGEFCFEWVDGTIKRVQFDIDDHITLQMLVDGGYISNYSVKTEDISRIPDSNLFSKTATITVDGPCIKKYSGYDDVIQTGVTLYASETVEYAENTNTPGPNTSYSNVANWQAGSSGNGDPNGTGFEEPFDNQGVEENQTFSVHFNLSDIDVLGLDGGTEDTAYIYQNYSRKIRSKTNYILPESLNVRIGDNTGTVDSSRYLYDRSYVDAPITITSVADTTIKGLYDSITEPLLSDRDYIYLGYSLDGGETLVSEEKGNTPVPAATEMVFYRVYRSKREGRITIYGHDVIGNIDISGNGVFEI